ncbi:MAG: hypothetical protein P8I74_01475 [Phycisphaerales bacterium]|nr:hypothetical protein [Phycisphaerales bacterium]
MLATCFILSLLAGTTDVTVKHLGAPPSDLDRGWLVEPDPREHGTRSHHSVHEAIFVDGLATIRIEVPRGGMLKLLSAGTGSETWTIEAISPGGASHSGDGTISKIRRGSMVPGGDATAQRLDIRDPEPGVWTVNVRGGERDRSMTLLVEDGSPIRLRAWLDDYSNLAGDTVTVHAGCSFPDDISINGDVAMSNATAAGATMLSMSARLLHEDGTSSGLAARSNRLQLHSMDAGIHTVIIDATIDDGVGGLLHRTATLPIAVEHDAPVLSGTAKVEPMDASRRRIELGLAGQPDRDRVLAGAEIWATSSDGHRPRCWIGGITPIDDGSISLVLDADWLHGCDADTVEIRSLRLADVDTFVALTRLDRLPLEGVVIPATRASGLRTDRMHMGVLGPDRFVTSRTMHESAPPLRSAQPGGHNLMLVHGYCEDGDAWPLNQFTGDFTEYENLSQNFSHDQFALDIRSFGNQYKSYSIVAHSQGGNAGLHLYTFYWSGLDWSTGIRKVQALGTPLQGTPLAGSIADLGAIFGIQCGSNYDMTYDGAAQWASFIPSWARASTWVWSTTFEDGWFYDYCNIGSDLLLSDPEDGVVEVSGAHLNGTNDMGTKEGWCHIQGMADPAQTLDTNRNDEMDSEGAR